MKLIAISGPRGAGKDTVQQAMVARFNGRLHRVVACTTRPPRPEEADGREYHFISDAQFDAHLAQGEFAFAVDISPAQRSGTLWSELAYPAGIVNVVPDGARRLKMLVEQKGGEAFLIHLSAPTYERFRRIQLREPDLDHAAVTSLIRTDPVREERWSYLDFDMCLANDEGMLDAAIAIIGNEIRRFISL